MGKLIIINDVQSDMDDDGLIPSNDAAASAKGESQSIEIANYLSTKVKEIDKIAASTAKRVGKLVHNIRLKIKTRNRSTVVVKRTEALTERNFGVLTGSRFALDSDLFSHTRICAEKGESLAQCRDRVMKFIDAMCKTNMRILVVSHPFVCQIVMNVILRKDHTRLTSFWLRKGSFAIFESQSGRYGINWKFKDAYNTFVDRQYTCEEIYSDLLGKEGS